MSLATGASAGMSSAATFGAGGSEPYARALLNNLSSGVLYLRELRRDKSAHAAEMDVARWNRDADDTDLRLLASVRGPVLDVGCGPARMVRAALDLGLEALGIDVSRAAVEVAAQSGISVLERSVFDSLPREGEWQTILLVDGNVGIGGDVDQLLARCRDLMSASGEIVVELHPDDDRDRTFTGQLSDEHGRISASFPWAEIGLSALLNRAEALGLELRQAWSADDRSFARLVKTRR